MLSLAINAVNPGDIEPITIALIIAFLAISLGVHEAAHGWVALKCGDTTARDLGRITLNPFAHIDPVLSVVLPAICMVTLGFPFGGAKPVPVTYHNLRNPARDMALVALAGPFANVLLAILFYAARKFLLEQGAWSYRAIGDQVFEYAIFLNMILAVFNMLPIPPLDGSRVLAWLLPTDLRDSYSRLESFGLLLVVLVLFFVPGVHEFMLASVRVLETGVRYVATAGGAW